MNLEELTREVGEFSVRSSRTDTDTVSYINRAIRRVSQRRNWNCLHDQRTVVMASGSLSTELDPDFKELSAERSPVSYYDNTSGNSVPIPCEVTSRAIATRVCSNPLISDYPTISSGFPFRIVFIEQNQGGRWTINIPQQYQSNPSLTYTISGYYFPRPLKLGPESNGISDHPILCDAVLNLAKHLAFVAEDPESTKAVAAYALYDQAYRSAIYAEVNQALAGRILRG